MRHIKYYINIGYCGCDDEGVTTVPDNYDNGDIDRMVNDMVYEYAQSWEGDARLGFSEDADGETAEQELEDFYNNVGGHWEWATPSDLEEYGLA